MIIILWFWWMVIIKSTTEIYDYFKFSKQHKHWLKSSSMMDTSPGIWRFRTKRFFPEILSFMNILGGWVIDKICLTPVTSSHFIPHSLCFCPLAALKKNMAKPDLVELLPPSPQHKLVYTTSRERFWVFEILTTSSHQGIIPYWWNKIVIKSWGVQTEGPPFKCQWYLCIMTQLLFSRGPLGCPFDPQCHTSCWWKSIFLVYKVWEVT